MGYVEIKLREVPEQLVVIEQRMVDQAALEAWLPGAMARVLDAAGDAGIGTESRRSLVGRPRRTNRYSS